MTPRSLVGMTQGARSRLAKYLAWGDAATRNKPQGRRDLLAEWPTLTSQKGGQAARALRLAYHEQRQELRVGERLRPCKGCCACDSPPDDHPPEVQCTRICDGSGVRPARKRGRP